MCVMFALLSKKIQILVTRILFKYFVEECLAIKVHREHEVIRSEVNHLIIISDHIGSI